MVGKKQDISGKTKNALYATGHFCDKIVLVRCADVPADDCSRYISIKYMLIIIRIQINFIPAVKSSVYDHLINIFHGHGCRLQNPCRNLIGSIVYLLCDTLQLRNHFSTSNLHRILCSFPCQILIIGLSRHIKNHQNTYCCQKDKQIRPILSHSSLHILFTVSFAASLTAIDNRPCQSHPDRTKSLLPARFRYIPYPLYNKSVCFSFFFSYTIAECYCLHIPLFLPFSPRLIAIL